MPSRTRPSTAALMASIGALVACGCATTSASPEVVTVGAGTVAGVGELPGDIGLPVNRDAPEPVLTEAGWDVEVDAEPGRFVDFGLRVLNRRLPPSDGADWDAAVVFFGSNFRGDYLNYEDQLREIISRLAPRPVLVLTVSEFAETRAVVNDIIRSVADGDPDVYLLDWADMTDAEPRLVGADGIHLTGAGRTRIVAEVALVLGEAPGRLEGECLPTTFTDDVLPTIVTE
ncbi:MAG: SGNH/GDSL hydrolase family protein [Ilumatobacter sp.]